jgi:hypothetical protein
MKTTLHWKKGAFSSTYKIYSDGHEAGWLKDQTFKQKSDGEIRHKKFRFKTEGLFKQQTHIIDLESNEVIGNIQYNSWMTRADIRIHDRFFRWKYDNGWQTKWSISDDHGVLLSFAGGMTKGSIERSDPEDLLVLTGLFVTNYYTQVGIAVFVAVFLPIWISVIN